MKKIEIYTTNYCPFCVKAKSLLNKKKIKFSEIDVSNDEVLREKMSAMANGARSVPQIFADNIHIGDCDKIHKLDQEKKLNKLLNHLIYQIIIIVNLIILQILIYKIILMMYLLLIILIQLQIWELGWMKVQVNLDLEV